MVLYCAVVVAILVVAALTVVTSAALDFSVPLEPRLLPHQHAPLHYSLDGALRLKDYLLIGTHGSAAYRLDPAIIVDDRGVQSKSIAGKIVPGLIKQWALNQHYDLYSQLALGARYVHLEVAVYGGEWVTIHSYLAGPLSADLDQITCFLDDTTDGFVLVHLERFGEQTEDRAGKTYMDHVRELDPKYHYHVAAADGAVTRETKISVLAGKMVVLGGCDEGLDMGIELYPGDYTGDMTTFDTNRTTQQIQASPPAHGTNPRRLVGLQWVMTPGAQELIVDVATPFHRSGLFDFVTVTDRTKLREYLVDHAVTPLLQTFHVFIVDHLDRETCRCIEDYNYQHRLLGMGA